MESPIDDAIIEKVALAIRSEIEKGWDLPLSITPESMSVEAASAALSACGYEEMHDALCGALEAMQEARRRLAYFDKATGELDLVIPIVVAALSKAVPPTQEAE